jgi:hypothetical protein
VLLEMVCGACGDVLIEVIATAPYRVVRFRRADLPNVSVEPRNDEDAVQFARRAYDATRAASGGSGEALRAGEWWFDPLPEVPDLKESTKKVPTRCRCRRIKIPMTRIRAELESARTEQSGTATQKVVIPARRR